MPESAQNNRKRAKARKPEILTEVVRAEKFIPGGQAIGTLTCGKKALLWNILPGESASEIQVTKNKSSYLEGIAIKHASTVDKLRATPRDAEYLATSPWQILDYQYELTEKRNLVEEALNQQKITLKNLQVEPTATDGKDYFYRNKMEYALYFDHADEKIHLAFHARGSHRKVPITSSSIERPEIYEAARKIVDELNVTHQDARRYQSLLLRANRQGEVSGGLLENGKKHPVFPKLQDKILGSTYNYSPNGFFQINLPVYELALQEMQKWVLPGKVLDLYAGVGTIGLSIARDHELTLVECDKSAYQELARNVRGVGVAPCVASGELSELTSGDSRFREEQMLAFASEELQNRETAKPAMSAGCFAPVTTGREDIRSPEVIHGVAATPRPVFAKSEEALDFIAPDQTVILDPPRAGCHQALIDKLLDVLPERIIYLSCNPITQARDVAMLQEKYQIDLIKPYNFFPRTPHIENLIVLTKLA